MNPILQVKLPFTKEANKSQPGPRNLRVSSEVTTEKIDDFIREIGTIMRYYQNIPQKIVENMLIDVHYNDIIAKSNRIKAIFKPEGENSPNDIVVGARFSDAPEGEENHIITYYVDTATINTTLENLETAKRFLVNQLNGKATSDNFNESKNIKPSINYKGYGLSKTTIRNIIVDCSVIESISVPNGTQAPNRDTFLVTFYKTELSISELLEALHIDSLYSLYSFYGENTISVTKDVYEVLCRDVPYLISMISSDLSQITMQEIDNNEVLPPIRIPSPSNEPIIGVIDTLFEENVYFGEWVENVDFLEDIEKDTVNKNSKVHGTEVTSIIVDGPRMNPWLDDGCGRFRVKHFGVCSNKISPSRLVRKIKDIVSNHPEIHVWNLSLGTEDEVSKNFISYDSAALDEIQSQKNVIFVISGTNDSRNVKSRPLKVGSPADSLNSVVVNSVRRNGSPASYSRRGNILSFFNKPDVSYYGGDNGEEIVAYSPTSGEEKVSGTSFAAPWISRKLCYLIDVIGIPREIAKSLLIDSAAGWNYQQSGYHSKDIRGYGVVPIDINKILSTDSDEIKFWVYGTSESYRTTNYAIPVPKNDDNKYPYVARATLCYFPTCSRAQGVDYTDRELSLKFGRIKKDGSIDDINDNIQDEEGASIDERESRRNFRKWENTKFISKKLRNNRALKSYDDRLWGLTITSKERLNSSTKQGLNFGIVITLKEINGINRIGDFVRACTLRGLIVNEIDINNQINIYNSNQEEIIFDEN